MREFFLYEASVGRQPLAKKDFCGLKEEETHVLLIEPAGTPNTGDKATAAPQQPISSTARKHFCARACTG
jgi:hypothetical protein